MSGRTLPITSRPATQPSASPTTWTHSAVESIASSPRRDSSWSSMRTTRLIPSVIARPAPSLPSSVSRAPIGRGPTGP